MVLFLIMMIIRVVKTEEASRLTGAAASIVNKFSTLPASNMIDLKF